VTIASSSTFVELKSAWADSDSVFHTVNVGNGPNHSAFKFSNNDMPLANFFSNTISAMDRPYNKAVDTIGIRGSPVSNAFSTRNNDMHLANPGSEPVYIIYRCYNKAVHTLPFDIDCSRFSGAFNPTNNDMHISDAFPNTIFIKDRSNKVVVTISVGNFSAGIGFNPSDNDMYVTNFGSNKVFVTAAKSAPIQQHQYKQQ
jgi:DNA-binding beta-propeller fold protein YncE